MARKEIEPSLAEWLNAGRDDIRKQLNQLAFEAHRDQPQLTGTADIRQGNLIAALLNASGSRADVKVVRLEEYVRDRAGILAARGVGIYQFLHRFFQEYLAACHLTDDEFPDKLADWCAARPEPWREVALLAGAKAGRGSWLLAWALAEALCVAPPPAGPSPATDHWGAFLAGCLLVECADLAQVAPRDAEKLRGFILAVLDPARPPSPRQRAGARRAHARRAGRSTTRGDDPRRHAFLPRAAGPSVWAATEAPGEKPATAVDVDYPYFVARFPVTLARWQVMYNTSAAPPMANAACAGVIRPSALRELARRAGVLRRAHAAVASAAAKGFVVTLPSEAEWEKAARRRAHSGRKRLADGATTWARAGNGSGRCTSAASVSQAAYPWGESFDADGPMRGDLGESSAVGCYPRVTALIAART